MNNSTYHFKKYAAFIFVIAVGIIILYPQLDFQFYLSQGDHGRDLYSFKKTFEGAIPYRDYASLNGPLMPYYYSLFYLLFGVSIQTTLWGYYFLVFLTGVFIYLSGRRYLGRILSVNCTLWYWAFRGLGFYYTYNHVGAIFLMVLVIFCLLSYIKEPKKRFLYISLLALLFMLLIRPNIGMASVFAFLFSLGFIISKQNIIQKKRKFLKVCLATAGVLFLSFLIYGLLTKGLPRYVATKDFAYYLRAVNPQRILPNITNLLELVGMLLFATWTHRLISLLLLVFCVRAVLLFKNSFTDKTLKTDYLLAIVVLSLFIFTTFLEYVVGVHMFRIGWFLAVVILLIFFILSLGLVHTTKFLRWVVCAIFLLMAVVSLGQSHLLTQSQKGEKTLLSILPHRVYVARQHIDWIHTVKPAVAYLKEHVPQDEKIVAIPYAPLYYFFSGRDSGCRDFSFFDASGEKELHAIKAIEENNVNFIILSNRCFRDAERRFGVFGKDYGKLLAAYVIENFEEVATFGPWDKPAHWIINHAVKIYKRRE